MEGGATALINAGKLASEEYNLLRGVGSDVAELRDDLATMNAVLRMQSEAEDGAVLDHFTEEWMKQLRELAYDSNDCVDLYKLRIKSRPNDGWCRWLRRHFETLWKRHELAGEISALRARAITISERHARYGLLNSKAIRRSHVVLAPVALHGGNNLEHYHPVGIEGQATTLVDQLKDEGEKQLRVFSIVGFGGLGKTTLALEVCRRLEQNFQCLALVSVSQAFEPRMDIMKALLKRLLHEILKNQADKEEAGTTIQRNSIQRDHINGMSVEKLTETLRKTVENKRYLIVVDDVWTIQAWSAILSKLPDNDCGSRLIVTTRILPVAEEACSRASDIHKMLPLNDVDSKNLFVSRVFGAGQSYPDNLEEVMDDILKKCGGLPLAIVSIASFLAAYKSPESRDKWDIVCKSIGSQMEGGHRTLEGMKHILTLSYNHLPHELKDCMVYLSIFPEDYEIDKERLLNRWIAEGLVPEKRGLTLMQVAESYFDELLGRSMIVPGSFDNCGRMESCRVHDILLEIMVSKSLKSNFASLLGGQYAGMLYDRIRRLSIQGPDSDSDITDSAHKKKSLKSNFASLLRGQCAGMLYDRIRRRLSIQGPESNSDSESDPESNSDSESDITDSAHKKKIEGHGWGHGLEGMDVKHVRSLSLFHAQERKLLDHLDKFTLLRVLDLEGCQELEDKHMSYICKLYLLKFLSLKDTNIINVPKEVEKLEHLQVLDVRGSGLVVSVGNRELDRGLSDKVTELKKLEHLLFFGLWFLPSGVGKMKALRKMGIAVLKDDYKIAQELGELKQLEALWIRLGEEIDNSDSEVVKEFAKSLGKMNLLRSLCISEDSSTEVLEFLHELETVPRFLRDIRLGGRVGGRLPNWIGSLSNLVEFSMSWARFSGDQPFCVLCKLPNLKSIYMERQCYIDTQLVARANYTTDASSTSNNNFPSLVSLEFSVEDDMGLEEFEIEKGSMKKLERLAIHMGSQDMRIVGIEHLINLKEVYLKGDESKTGFQNTLKQLRNENDKQRPKKFQIKSQ